MMSTTPIEPPVEVLNWINENWTINYEEGVILNKKGVSIGSPHNSGYIIVSVRIPGFSKQILFHHLIWWKAKGVWPTMQIDHKDQNKKNNRFGNLLEATHSRQMHNRVMPVGYYGQGIQKTKSKLNPRYEVRICVNNKTGLLGTFDTVEEASRFRQRGKDLLLRGVKFKDHKELRQHLEKV
jgi:hypothetical protein